MVDQHSSNASGRHTSTRERSAKRDSLDITALIRSIQRDEGNFDCFRKARGYCDQLDCAWRSYCLES